MTLAEVIESYPYLVAAGAAIVAWLTLGLLRRRTTMEMLPVPDGAEWLFGHEKTVFMNTPGVAYRKWISQLGLAFRIKAAFGARDILVLSDPTAIAYVLQKRIYDYHHSHVVRPRIARLLGKGLGWVEGEAEHKRMRHLVGPALTSENVKRMSGEIRAGALQVIDELTGHVQGAKDSAFVNILDWTGKATLNITGRVAFLHDFKAGNSEHAEQILTGRRQGTLMLLRRFPLLNDLPIPAIQSQGAAKMAIHSGIANELVRRDRDVLDAEAAAQQHKDLLTRLLAAHAKGDISKEELYEQISTFIIAGHETTTQSLGFTIFELARHPDVQEKLREELKQFPREPTYDDYQTQLPYLDAVVKETLRMYPALPYIERIAMKEDVLPLREPVHLSNGQVVSHLPIPAGQVVVIPAIAIQRQDSIWKDPDVFRPERWLNDMPPSEQLVSGWAHTLAFSDGPRNCIGLRLALFQYKVILQYLMERFRFHDTELDIFLKISSSLQAWVVDRPELGPALPVRVELL
ncbi:cytochrome P450 [Trametes coccinea BRFM310]|uniref:Cytochrome P450 n=1 Tax=Trametes coccinea (strain BRFM310) TaxID=1353009 RepID=A0A1Y2J2X1_TRAC3|nr:cytochrome P450 [Trametes coccinea BRFM310]